MNKYWLHNYTSASFNCSFSSKSPIIFCLLSICLFSLEAVWFFSSKAVCVVSCVCLLVLASTSSANFNFSSVSNNWVSLWLNLPANSSLVPSASSFSYTNHNESLIYKALKFWPHSSCTRRNCQPDPLVRQWVNCSATILGQDVAQLHAVAQ